MTTLDYAIPHIMNNHPFMSEHRSAYDGYPSSSSSTSSSSAAMAMTSPHFSPTVGSHQEDYNQLLEAWTHNSFGSNSNSAEDMYSSAMSQQQQQHHQQQYGGEDTSNHFFQQPPAQHVQPFQNAPPAPSHNLSASGYAHPTIFQPSSAASTVANTSTYPSSHGGNNGLGFTDAFRIQPSHYAPPSTASSSTSNSSGLFVNEQIPQSISPQESIGSSASSSSSSSSNTTTTTTTSNPLLQSQSQAHSNQQQLHQSASRESLYPMSRRSTLDSSVAASQIASLSLNSPHHSVSAGSSSTSSSQNSPTTPLSAYGYDSQTGNALSFQQQQQQLLLHHQQNLINTKNLQGLASSSMNPLSASIHPGHLHGHSGAGFNQMSGIPPSQISPTQTTFQASMPMSQSHSRMSSAGLMDQVVSSRKALASPTEPETDQMPSINGILSKHDSEDMKKSLSRSTTTTRARSRTSSTPPTTPGRASVKTFRNPLTASASTPNALADSVMGSTAQTPSSVGPHRTPSKRGLAMSINEGADGHLHMSPIPSVNAAMSPQRPGIRRTASHTPKSTRKGSTPAALTPAGNGLASPADMQLRNQQLAAGSSLPPSQKARIANAEADLELTSANAATMMRAMSSPGYAVSPNHHNNFASSTGSQSGSRPSSRDSVDSSNRNRRSSTLSGLQMSPLPPSAIGTTSLHNASDIYSRQHQLQQSRKAASSSPVNTVSYAEALLALDQVDAFLEGQAKQLSNTHNQQPSLALGTQDQIQGIRDIRQRIQTRLQNGIIP